MINVVFSFYSVYLYVVFFMNPATGYCIIAACVALLCALNKWQPIHHQFKKLPSASSSGSLLKPMVFTCLV